MSNKKEIALIELKSLMKELSYVMSNNTIIKKTKINQSFIYNYIGKRTVPRINRKGANPALYKKQFKRINELFLIIANKPGRHVNRPDSEYGYDKFLRGPKNQHNLATLHKANPFVQLSLLW